MSRELPLKPTWQWVGLSLALLLAIACHQPSTLEEFGGETMGTTYSVKIATTTPLSELERGLLSKSFEGTLNDINQKMSTYLDDSELSRFNQFGAGEPYAISEDLLRVLTHAEDTFLATAGAFDPTVGPAVDLWGFGPTERSLGLPSEAEIEVALSQVSWSKVRLDRQSSTVLKTEPSLRLDLSAIAKGYAVDELADRTREAGFTDFLVEVGGELRASGLRDRGSSQAWSVGIEKPPSGPSQRATHRIVNLKDTALATSGDYRNAYLSGGRRYSHTIDPKTGRPVTHRGASASVFAQTCMQADAIATALLVMGPDLGLGWAEQNNVPVLFLVYNEDGSVGERRTAAMDSLLVDTSTR